VICGPGSKALLFGLMAAIGGQGAGIAVTRPSWVSYAAQAALSGRTAHFVPGAGGVPDADHPRPGGDGGAGGGQPGPFGHSDAPRQPDRQAGPGRGRAGAVLGGRGARPGDHLGRDLPGSGPRSGGAVHQSRRHKSRTDGGDRRPEQEPRPRGLAPRRGPAARRRVRARPARPAARHRQRDLVRPGRAGCSRPRHWPSASRRSLAERVALSRRLHGSVARAVAHRFAVGRRRGAPRRKRPSTSTRTSPRWPTCCSSGTASPATRAWRRCCCTSTALGCCRAARSARTAGGCGLLVATAMLYGDTDDEAAHRADLSRPVLIALDRRLAGPAGGGPGRPDRLNYRTDALTAWGGGRVCRRIL